MKWWYHTAQKLPFVSDAVKYHFRIIAIALCPTVNVSPDSHYEMNELTIVMTVEWLYLALDVTAGRGVDDAGGSSKRRGHGNHSPEKSSSRSPLRNTTLDSNVRKNNVEFREPLASFRYRPNDSSTSLINRAWAYIQVISLPLQTRWYQCGLLCVDANG